MRLRLGMYVACDVPESTMWWVGREINGGSAELEGGAMVYLYGMQAFAFSYSRALHCILKLHDGCIGS
jgi:hypothetical protein